MKKIFIPEGFELKKLNETEYHIVKIEQPEPKHKEKEWEEFGEVGGVYIDSFGRIRGHSEGYSNSENRNIFPTTTTADWHGIIMPQLLQWRLKYIGDWKVNWSTGQKKWNIRRIGNSINIDWNIEIFNELSFPTKEIAETFYKDHKSLIDKMLEL